MARIAGTLPRAVIIFTLIIAHAARSQDRMPPSIERLDTAMLSTQSAVYVRRFSFTGNTVYSDDDLEAILADYRERSLSSEQLEEARLQLTRHYVDHGYINSGALLLDQPVTNDGIRFTIIEGKLTEVRLSGMRRLRPRRMEARLRRAAGVPLNLHALRDELQTLRSNPNIGRVSAELQPGVAPGESYLNVNVVEEQPFRLAIAIDNHRTPAVGAERLTARVSHGNLFGFSDPLDLVYGVTKDDLDEVDLAGLDDVDLSYSLPLNTYDTMMRWRYRRTDVSIIEESFQDLYIDSGSETVLVGFSQPIYRKSNDDFTLSLDGERRKSRTLLRGQPFQFSPGADRHGESRATVLRFTQNWSRRTLNHVATVRSSVNYGVDALGASDGGKDPPRKTTRDGKFVSWLGQFQFVRRLGESAGQTIVKANVQWTDDELLPMEQFSLGGFGSVRGYRENQMIRDRGMAGTVEIRFPVIFDRRGRERLQLAPFFDYGGGANVGRDFDDLQSVGVGLIFTPTPRWYCDLYWGHRLRGVADNNGSDLQDDGVHFSISLTAF